MVLNRLDREAILEIYSSAEMNTNDVVVIVNWDNFGDSWTFYIEVVTFEDFKEKFFSSGFKVIMFSPPISWEKLHKTRFSLLWLKLITLKTAKEFIFELWQL